MSSMHIHAEPACIAIALRVERNRALRPRYYDLVTCVACGANPGGQPVSCHDCTGYSAAKVLLARATYPNAKSTSESNKKRTREQQPTADGRQHSDGTVARHSNAQRLHIRRLQLLRRLNARVFLVRCNHSHAVISFCTCTAAVSTHGQQ